MERAKRPSPAPKPYKDVSCFGFYQAFIFTPNDTVWRLYSFQERCSHHIQCGIVMQRDKSKESVKGWVCVHLFVWVSFFYIQQMFALLYILRRSDKRCKERSCWRKNKRVFRHARWSFKVYPLSQYFFLFPVLYKWITAHLSSPNQPPSFQCNSQVWLVFSQV